jgi:hypothetical protein
MRVKMQQFMSYNERDVIHAYNRNFTFYQFVDVFLRIKSGGTVKKFAGAGKKFWSHF